MKENFLHFRSLAHAVHSLSFFFSPFKTECIFLYDYWSESEFILHCTKEDLEYFGKEHNLAVFNHIYEIDWLIAWVLIDKFKGLGYARGFIKNSIKYIPLWGWFFGMAGHIFLKRSFEKDKELIEKKIAEYMNFPSTNCWVVLMAEGTRFTKEKFENCLKFAKERSIEPLKHHLIPRAKGFSTCVPLLDKYNCPAVYNVQVSYDPKAANPPYLGTLVMGKKITTHVYIRRYPINQVDPTFEFLYDVYKEKDALQDSMHKYGNFYEGRGLKIEKGFTFENRIRIFFNTLCWVLFESFLIAYQAHRMIENDQVMMLTIIGVCVTSLCKCKLLITLRPSLIDLFCLLVYFMLKNILHLSKSAISGSEYGKTQ
jgi:lysophosphatidic acid acyltransferase/lysophosphatidylinositol acyltransferase